MLELRPYRPGDFQRLLEIDQACFVRGISYTAGEMRHFLNLSTAIRIVGEQEGEVQGFIIADKFRSRRSQQFMGHIITIDVMAEARRNRLGSRLLEAVEMQVRDAGCAYVSLETAVDNTAAFAFYKRHGYELLKTIPRYYQNSVDAFLLRKHLA